MLEFRDKMAKEVGMELLVHINQDGVEQGIGPFTHGSSKHTDVMKTAGLKQELDKYGFDAAFGGPVVTRKNPAPRNVSILSATASTAGTRKISVPSCGAFITARSTRAKAFVFFRCPTGRSWISGSTSIWKTSPLCPCTLRPNVRLLNVTA
jgi:sulfate adenylyltransferase subunit 2